ncbi:hypothetical protein UFOVP163_28 [uncultured Caudovirales phage]|uniref:Uncharacterized protein n=1 Tax=uncultured Caudovirales phage TaxID=2100421 RepID=A0A6J7WE61_9CAUD|nr:hypothetical protein UFOVP163_28 [uncultured Caudovirales phage]
MRKERKKNLIYVYLYMDGDKHKLDILHLDVLETPTYESINKYVCSIVGKEVKGDLYWGYDLQEVKTGRDWYNLHHRRTNLIEENSIIRDMKIERLGVK